MNIKNVNFLASINSFVYLCKKSKMKTMEKNGKFIKIQEEVIKKYGITINHNSTCRMRTHAHVKERKICKWEQKNSIESTFTLLHEIGHCETKRSSMRRSESEYYATCWAIDRCREYGLSIPEKTLHSYQRYILQEVARGKRRGGTRYNEMNIYKYYGINKTLEEFKKELDPEWAQCIVPFV